jgi:hypothetical protein
MRAHSSSSCSGRVHGRVLDAVGHRPSTPLCRGARRPPGPRRSRVGSSRVLSRRAVQHLDHPRHRRPAGGRHAAHRQGLPDALPGRQPRRRPAERACAKPAATGCPRWSGPCAGVADGPPGNGDGDRHAGIRAPGLRPGVPARRRGRLAGGLRLAADGAPTSRGRPARSARPRHRSTAPSPRPWAPTPTSLSTGRRSSTRCAAGSRPRSQRSRRSPTARPHRVGPARRGRGVAPDAAHPRRLPPRSGAPLPRARVDPAGLRGRALATARRARPARPVARDVAGMLRSFDYAAAAWSMTIRGPPGRG